MKTSSALARASLEAAAAIDERYPGYRRMLVSTFAEAIKRFPEASSQAARQRAIEKLIEAVDQAAREAESTS